MGSRISKPIVALAYRVFHVDGIAACTGVLLPNPKHDQHSEHSPHEARSDVEGLAENSVIQPYDWPHQFQSQPDHFQASFTCEILNELLPLEAEASV